MLWRDAPQGAGRTRVAVATYEHALGQGRKCMHHAARLLGACCACAGARGTHGNVCVAIGYCSHGEGNAPRPNSTLSAASWRTACSSSDDASSRHARTKESASC